MNRRQLTSVSARSFDGRGWIAALALAAACGQPVEPSASSGTFKCSDHPGMGAAVGQNVSALNLQSCYVRTHESEGANYIADAVWYELQNSAFSGSVTQQAVAANARFYMGNTGGLQLKTVVPPGEICAGGYIAKTPPGSGDFTKGKTFAQALVPFHNSVVLVTMKQSLLKQVLERSFAIAVNSNGVVVSYPNTDGSLIELSGNFRYTVNLANYSTQAQRFTYPNTTQPGSLITSATLDGVPLDLNSSTPITFAANAFLAGCTITNGQIVSCGSGGGVSAGFYSDAFRDPSNQFQLVDAGKDPAASATFTETNAVVSYFASHPIVQPKIDGRLTLLNPQPAQAVNLCQ